MHFDLYQTVTKMNFIFKNENIGRYFEEQKDISESKMLKKYKDAIWNVQGYSNHFYKNSKLKIDIEICLYGISKNEKVIMRKYKISK